MLRVVKLAIIVGCIIGCVAVVALLCRSPSPKSLTPIKKHVGRTLEEVVGELGQPAFSYSFTMGQPMDEMHVSLLNMFPPDKPGNKDIEIRELRWRDGDYFIALWFYQNEGKWLAVDGVRWHKNTVF